ncbi:hypothetical protein AQUCO_03000196v1 [Aquilegia coerulea]|uniref:Uncharacterized protein n=1 Tax=Aquilegia coerulea TaxID=218851 RepID=A0A2G5D1Q5_AQUCA|nr:hypothetical protein AQUCO_03000196v1 [Aquilegia coerulea]
MDSSMTKSKNFMRNLLVRTLLLCVFVLILRFVYVVTIVGESCKEADFCFFNVPENLNIVGAGTGVQISSSAVSVAGGSSKNSDLWTSKEWRKAVDFYSSVFQDLITEGVLTPNSKALCVETPNGQEVFALKEIGVADSVGISNKKFPPLVVSGKISEQPFDDNTFDFVFYGGGGLDRLYMPFDFAVEIGRTLKPEGFLVVHTASAKDMYSFNSFIGLFKNCCRLVKSRDIEGFNSSFSSIREIVMKKEVGIQMFGEKGFENSKSKCAKPGYKLELVTNAEPLITEEPLKPWITLKRNIQNIKYLASIADISFKQKYVYVDVGARSYGSSIYGWFKKHYPKQNKTFDIYAIEADKTFHEEYKTKKGITLLPYAAWVKNETLFFEINRDPGKKVEDKGRGMGRIQPIQSAASSVSDVDKIQGFDFADWLKNTVTEKDFVVMKMDVEGTEFDLIPRLFETGAICLIDEIFLECHYNRWQKCCPGERITSKGFWLGENPLNYSSDLLLFELPLISIVTCTLYLLLKPLGHPAIVYQILTGLVLGPSCLGRSARFMTTVFPVRGKVILETYALFGFILFQFVIGVRMDPKIITEGGKRPIIIGLVGYLSAISFGAVTTVLLRTFVKMDVGVSRALGIVVGTESMSDFTVISCFLADLKILNTEIGRIASASSIISDICTFMTLTTFKFGYLATKDKALENTIGLATSSILLVGFIVFFIRPAVKWVIRKTPEGDEVKEIYVFGIIITMFICVYVSQITGQGYIMAPFFVGLVIPDGPPLGSALIDKLDFFVTVLFMPIFFTLCGLKTDIYSLDRDVFIVHIVTIACFLAKIIGTIVPSLYCSMPIRDAFILSLIMNSKGVIELGLYNTYLEDQMLSRQAFTLLMISVLVITVIVSRIVQTFYNPSRQYMSYRRRTIQHAKRDTELGILTCVHSEDNVSSLIQLMEMSNPKKEHPLHIYVLHLVELVGRATSLLVTHHRHGKPSSRSIQSEHIIKAFRYYEETRQGLVWVDLFTSISPFVTMHDDVCSLALQKRTYLVILPFHKRWVADGALESSPAIRNLNCNVLEKAPCSVGILINNRSMSSSLKLESVEKQMYCIAILFFGGADDREALSYAARMAEHPNVRLTMIRFTSKEHIMYNDESVRLLDVEFLNEFKNETLQNDRVWAKEEIVTDGSGVISVITSMQNAYDLVIVGRRHMETSLTTGLSDWTENPELGVIGDILAGPEFRGVPSVLVIQQQSRVWGMQNVEF